MKTYGKWRYTSIHPVEVSGKFHAPATLPPGEKSYGTHWIGGLVGHSVDLDAVAQLLPGIEHRSSSQ